LDRIIALACRYAVDKLTSEEKEKAPLRNLPYSMVDLTSSICMSWNKRSWTSMASVLVEAAATIIVASAMLVVIIIVAVVVVSLPPPAMQKPPFIGKKMNFIVELIVCIVMAFSRIKFGKKCEPRDKPMPYDMTILVTTRFPIRPFPCDAWPVMMPWPGNNAIQSRASPVKLPRLDLALEAAPVIGK
jgi:hypothetical protein